MTDIERVWIELVPARNNEEGHRRAELLSNMLKSIGVKFDKPVWYKENTGRYCFVIDEAGGFVEAGSNGHWFNLSYFGKLAE